MLKDYVRIQIFLFVLLRMVNLLRARVSLQNVKYRYFIGEFLWEFASEPIGYRGQSNAVRSTEIFVAARKSSKACITQERVLQVVYSLYGGIITDTRVFLCGGYKRGMDLDMCQLEFIEVAS